MEIACRLGSKALEIYSKLPSLKNHQGQWHSIHHGRWAVLMADGSCCSSSFDPTFVSAAVTKSPTRYE
jgi:hypothetical protein